MEISLCMIVRDEEKNLAQCLNSVHDLVEEIVIVDTGSTDSTKEIASKYTNKIYDFEWIDDFAAARNFAFSKGTKEYLMWLDADDMITEPNRQKFKQLKEGLDSKYQAVTMTYLMSSNQTALYSFARTRIVKHQAGYCWEGDIHETLKASSVSEVDIYNSDVKITHTKPPQASARNLKMLSDRIAKGNADLWDRFYYARDLILAKRENDAIMQLEKYFEEGGENHQHGMQACLMLHKLLSEKGEFEQALKVMSAHLDRYKQRSEFCCHLGDFYREKVGDTDEAIFWYTEATYCKEDPKEMSRMERYYYYVPCFWLSRLYEAQGNLSEAQKYAQYALHFMNQLEDTGEGTQ